MPRRHHMRWAMDVIDESIKKSAVPGAPPDAENKDEDDYDYEDIHVRTPRHCIQRAAELCIPLGSGCTSPTPQPCHRLL